ncbi:hypothetical protein LOD99_12982 [Oopsacas minuta]|uniref:Uncharacterized protein n=1 Tax=Oopsacas minuta TaxID=111878 RepID=A0AAV7J9V3_9METZ|nr:hypothetical protein LOD99_12982 [Oopsacas minuta]
MASNMDNKTTLSLTAFHTSHNSDVNITTNLPEPLTIPCLLENLKSLREKSNKEISRWVEEEKIEEDKTVKKKRKVSENDLSDVEETDKDLDNDIDKILSAQVETDKNSQTKKSRI